MPDRLAGLPGYLQRRRQQAGHRGAALAIVAVLDILYGISLLTGHQPSPTLITLLAPVTTWGWVFAGTGIMLATGIWLPPGQDRWHFMLAVLAKSAWGSFILAAEWAVNTTQAEWGGALTWFALAAFLLLTSGLHK